MLQGLEKQNAKTLEQLNLTGTRATCFSGCHTIVVNMTNK